MKIRIQDKLAQLLLKTYIVLSTVPCVENLDIFGLFNNILFPWKRYSKARRVMCKRNEMNEKLMNYVNY